MDDPLPPPHAATTSATAPIKAATTAERPRAFTLPNRHLSGPGGIFQVLAPLASASRVVIRGENDRLSLGNSLLLLASGYFGTP